MYLAWFDGDRKKSVQEKILDARARYLYKFGVEPAVCLVNPADLIEESVVELRPATYIGRNCFWIGVDDRDEVTVNGATAGIPVTPPLPPEGAPTSAARPRRRAAASAVETSVPALATPRRARRERTAA